MQYLKMVVVNTFSQYVGRFGMIIISLISTSLLTRLLGKQGYGEFGVITTAVLFFVTISDWGIQSISVREASKEGNNRYEIFSNSFRLKTIISLTITLLYFLFALLYPGASQFRTAFLLASPLILILSFRTSALVVHQTSQRLFIPAITDLMGNLTFVFFCVLSLSISSNISLDKIILFLCVATAINALLTITPVFKSLIKVVPTARLTKQLFRLSLPMGAYLVVFSVYNRIDTFILNSVAGSAATGIYVLSYKVHENLIMGAAYLMNSLFPIISKNKQNAQKVIKFALPILTLFGTSVFVLGFFFAPLIVKILAGEQFAESVPVLRILLLATGVSYLNHLFGYSLVAIGKQSVSLRFAILALAFNLTLNIIFIPKYSYMAAAVITVLTELLMLIQSVTYLVAKEKISLRPDFNKNILNLLKNE